MFISNFLGKWSIELDLFLSGDKHQCSHGEKVSFTDDLIYDVLLSYVKKNLQPECEHKPQKTAVIQF